MKRLTQNEFDQSTLEAMMERYRAELLRYQRATPPGKPTLEQNIKTAALENTEPPPAEDIWEQPAVFAAQQQTDIPPMPTEQPTLLLSPSAEQTEQIEPLEVILPDPPAAINFDEYQKQIGAFGRFVPYPDANSCCKAEFLSCPTDVTARFAADIPQGGAESSRCRKSFWVRFFCKNGYYDMPSYLLWEDAANSLMLSAQLTDAAGADPKTGLRDKSRFWRLVCDNPACLCMALRLYTDMATISSYRMADSFSPPVIWTDQKGGQKLVRTRWLSSHRPKTLNRFEAEELSCSDPDALSRDLIYAIKNGQYPQFELAAQMMDYPPPADCGFDPLDSAAEWSEQRFPLKKLGQMTLDRLPNHFADEIAALKLDAKNLDDGIALAPLVCGSSTEAASAMLSAMGEYQRKTLVLNMTDDLRQLPAELLEELLLLITKADLTFGRMVTAALGGI